MNVLIIHAHENADSFCSTLSNLAVRTLTVKGHAVTISDLYQKGFDPVASAKDFTKLSSANYYKYAMEQIHASELDLFNPQITEEMNLLEAADVLIFNFPLWWFGLPVILKGWVDKVLAYGFAYGGDYGLYEKGKFKGKKALLCLTTGSPESAYTEAGMHGRTLPNILKNIEEGILGLVGYEVLPAFIAYSVSRISDADRSHIMDEYQDFLRAHL